MQTAVQPASPVSFLRVYTAPAHEVEEPSTSFRHNRISAAMTLTEFYQDWYLPIVLESENRKENTLKSYEESLEYWKRLTDNPPLSMIDEFTIAEFSNGLKTETFTRSNKENAKRFALSQSTITKHLRQVRAVLSRTGPTIDPNKPGKSLVPIAPHVKVTRPINKKAKDAITLEEARAMMSAIKHLPATSKLPKEKVCSWFKTLIKTLYYTGLRIGTVLQLTESMISGDGKTLHVPGHIVSKTSKAIDKPLHPEGLRALRKTRGKKYLLEWPHCRRYLSTIHGRIQSIAGVPLKDQKPLHAWRRTHGVEMAKLGAGHAMRAAQHALDHSDAKTTSDHYVDTSTIEQEIILFLPYLEVVVEQRDRQLYLF